MIEGVDVARLKALAALSAEELGETEEDVKVRFVVPLLEALGHSRMRFEHKGRDIVLKDGLPRGSAVVVEVKRPEVGLDLALAQLERYALAERSLLSILTNGRVVRLYSAFWNRAKTFADALLWEFPRRALADSRVAGVLAAVLSRGALASKAAALAVRERETYVEFFWEEAEDLRRRQAEWRGQLAARIREIDARMTELDAEQRVREKQLAAATANESEKVRRLFRLAGVPLVAGGEFGWALGEEARAAAPAGAGEAPRRRGRPPARTWTKEDLSTNATVYQQRILATFVALGRRTLGLKELSRHVGLDGRAILGALGRYRVASFAGGRKPLIEVRRTAGKEQEERGNLCCVAARYWPLLRSLYPARAEERASHRGHRGHREERTRQEESNHGSHGRHGSEKAWREAKKKHDG